MLTDIEESGANRANIGATHPRGGQARLSLASAVKAASEKIERAGQIPRVAGHITGD